MWLAKLVVKMAEVLKDMESYLSLIWLEVKD
jgi:hypothetical protein